MALTLGLHVYTRDEVTVFRRPSEFLAWFEELLDRTKGNATKRQAALTHEGSFKVFYEEIFPLASLLRVKSEAWKQSEFRNVLGSQQYDVEIRNHPLKYIEIVSTDYDDGERFRMLRFIGKGSIDAIGQIERDADDRPIGIRDEGAMRRHDQVVQERLALVENRIQKKLLKTYPPLSGLLVYIDDYSVPLNQDDRARFSSLLRATRCSWSSVFDSVFLVGPKAEFCIEETRA